MIKVYTMVYLTEGRIKTNMIKVHKVYLTEGRLEQFDWEHISEIE